MKNHEWHPRFPKDEMTGPGHILTCEEAGALQRFRDYAWVNGGFSKDEKELRALAQTFRLSRYKFLKIWSTIENFFTIIDGVFVYADDEQHRQKEVVRSSKRHEIAQLAANKRWKNQVVPISGHPELPMHDASETDAIPELKEYSNSVNVHTPSAAAETPPGGVCDPPGFDETIQNKRENPYIPHAWMSDVTAIRARTVALGLETPSKKFCKRLREKFLHVPISEMLESLVRWEGQRSVGMWEQMSIDDFRAEAIRQRTPDAGTTRKPSQRQLDDAELMRRAHERDLAREANA